MAPPIDPAKPTQTPALGGTYPPQAEPAGNQRKLPASERVGSSAELDGHVSEPGSQEWVRQTARAQIERLDEEARASGYGPMERALRGIDAAAGHLAGGRPELAAAVYGEEALRIRASLPPSGADRAALELIADELEARAALYRATDTRSARGAASRLAFRANQNLRVADMMEKESPEHARLLRAVGTDGMLQARAMNSEAAQADAALGKSFTRVYREIVDKSFEKKIDEYGGVKNALTGGRKKLEEDRATMKATFDCVDQLIEREGIPFHEAWRRMFKDDSALPTSAGPGVLTAREAALFIRDHEVAKGLLDPMADISEGIWNNEPAKMDGGRARLVTALQGNKQWEIAQAVLEDFKKSAVTALGKSAAKRLDDDEWKVRWTSHAKDFVGEELPVLLLSGAISGGTSVLARGGAVALNLGWRARTGLTVGAELVSFTASEKLLNDAINGKRADWSAGGVARDLTFGAAGYGVLKGVGKAWQAFRAAQPNLGRFGELFRGRAEAMKATAEAAESTAASLRDSLSKPWQVPGVRTKHLNVVREEGSRLLDEIEQAQALLSDSVPGPARAKLERALAEAEPVARQLREYLEIQASSLPKGRAATAAEKEAYAKASAEFQARELKLREALVADLQRSTEGLYKVQAELSRVRISPVGQEAGAPFRQDPVHLAKAHRVRHGLGADSNVAYGELSIGKGDPASLGPAASGSGPGSLQRTNRYASASRPLKQQDGAHSFPRANDSEVQLLEAAAKALGADPNASGVLRLFTERPPCASCRRAMARFLADHPNIKLEVHYSGKHLPPAVGIGAGEAVAPEDER